MPRAYPAEFRARAIALVRAGKEQKQIAVDLRIHPVTLPKWLRQVSLFRFDGHLLCGGQAASVVS
jgi:transposase-like protein